jgi:hypothetical protein
MAHKAGSGAGSILETRRKWKRLAGHALEQLLNLGDAFRFREEHVGVLGGCLRQVGIAGYQSHLKRPSILWKFPAQRLEEIGAGMPFVFLLDTQEIIQDHQR